LAGRGGGAAPGSLPAWRAAAWLDNWVWGIPTAAAAFLFLLFPTGRLRSKRWRPAAWFVAAVFCLLMVASSVNATRDYDRPFASFAVEQTPVVLRFEVTLVPVAMLVSVAALIWRFAKSEGEERLQMKWLALAAAVLIVAFVPDVLTNSFAAQVLLQLAFLFVNAAIGIAVLRYRLYDIDLVISKAIQYGVLAAFITAVYAALVVGVGTAADDEHSVWLSAIAAGVAAIAFQPARQRAAQLANRLVYGRRATPYQALSQFARRIGGTYADEDVLPQMARIVAAGTGAARAVVWLRLAGELRPAATAGQDPGPADTGPAVSVPPAAGEDDTVSLPDLPGADTAVPITYKGELLGAIAIRMPRDEPLRPAGAQLVADMAAQAGPVLSNVGLVSELRASRQRLVTAQDEARRRLERNLHDGAQQDLVALAIKLNLLASADGDPTEATQLLTELKADTSSALENLRDLARGIYPPLLADHGLVAALGAQARKSLVPLTIEADGIGRFPEETEAAVYFCCLEALQNTAKYARAAAARIELGVTAGSLCFTVTDDGAGYDAARAPLGAGLRNMTDRLAALGGSLQVRSAPGHGTAVTGRLPVLGPRATDPAPGGRDLLGGEQPLEFLLDILRGDEEQLVAALQRVLRLRHEHPPLAQDGDQGDVRGPLDRADLLPGERRVGRHGHLDQARLALAERHQPHQVADAHGLLDERGEQARRRDGDVDAPGLVVQPLVARVVHPGDDPGHAVLGLGEQRNDQVDLVVAGRGDDNVAPVERGVVERADLARVGEQPFGPRDAVHLDRAGLLVDQQHLMAVLEQLAGDGPAHGSCPGDGDPHQ
jgi:signal transduction histidine kinase